MKQKYFPTDEELAIVRDHYDGTSFQLSKIMRLLGRKYPRWYITRLGGELGLARIKEPFWAAAEEAYLQENYPRFGLKALRRGMINRGMFPRSTTAIKLKLKRLGMAAFHDDGFTLRGLQLLLWGGQEQHHILARWVEKGWLRGKRRGTLRRKSQGGDTWYFSPEAVRSFIINHPEEVDLRLVDAVPFIRLLAGDSETLVLCRCPRCGREWEKKVFAPGVSLMLVYCDACRIAVDALGDQPAYRISAS